MKDQWTSLCSADGSVPFAVFVEGHRDLDLSDPGEDATMLLLGTMTFGYSEKQAQAWVDSAETGQFWLVPLVRRSEDDETLWRFGCEAEPGARPITGAKFL
jgi:hypothetical protein